MGAFLSDAHDRHTDHVKEEVIVKRRSILFATRQRKLKLLKRRKLRHRKSPVQIFPD